MFFMHNKIPLLRSTRDILHIQNILKNVTPLRKKWLVINHTWTRLCVLEATTAQMNIWNTIAQITTIKDNVLYLRYMNMVSYKCLKTAILSCGVAVTDTPGIHLTDFKHKDELKNRSSHSVSLAFPEGLCCWGNVNETEEILDHSLMAP